MLIATDLNTLSKFVHCIRSCWEWNLKGRVNEEVRYAQEFVERAARCLLVGSEGAARLADADGTECRMHTGLVQACSTEQKHFFRDLDAAQEGEVGSDRFERFERDLEKSLHSGSHWMTPILSEFSSIVGEHPSRTVVMEAAFFLIQSDLLRIPGVGCVNVKQARALLHHARWIQACKTKEWESTGILLPEGPQLTETESLHLIMIGAAGTGKSTVLRIVEALSDKFFGPDSVRKGAPSNTAARLLGGDTIHALCKLPFIGTIYGKRGHLSAAVLRRLKDRWKNARFTAMKHMPYLFLTLSVINDSGARMF
jgi:hypothetical protein